MGGCRAFEVKRDGPPNAEKEAAQRQQCRQDYSSPERNLNLCHADISIICLDR